MGKYVQRSVDGTLGAFFPRVAAAEARAANAEGVATAALAMAVVLGAAVVFLIKKVEK